MQFAKAPRFAQEKVSDNPGPNAYSPSDRFAAADNYKRGALFEGSDRFSRQRAMNDNAHDSDGENRPLSPVPLQSRNRASTVVSGANPQLAKQVEQMKLHNIRITKEYQIERERLQEKLTHAETMLRECQKENSNLQGLIASMTREQRVAAQREAALRASLEKAEARDKALNDRSGRHTVLEKRLEDLQRVHDDSKKFCDRKLSEQGEAHLQAKRQLESQLQESKKQYSALQGDLRALKGKLAERERLDSVTAKERQKRDDQENKLKGALVTSETALSNARKFATQLESDLDKAKQEARRAEETSIGQSNMIIHLRGLLQITARQFGILVQSSIPREAHEDLSMTCSALRLRIVRLERKYADRDAQMRELASLVRAMESHQRQLLECLECAETSLQRVTDLSNERLKDTLELVGREEGPHIKDFSWTLEDEREKSRVLRVDLRSAKLYVKLGDERLFQARDLCEALISHLEKADTERLTLEAQLRLQHERTASIQLEIDNVLVKTQDLERRARHAEIEEQHWKKKFQNLEVDASKGEQRWSEAIGAEKVVAKKLTHALQQSKLREAGLQSEVEALQSALEAATSYEQLFADAVHTLKEVAARNALAEAESERLSRFNAEIISQSNPQNRIFYLDRIRRQLADTQQKLIHTTNDLEELEEENVTLRHELGLYKSVPTEMKTRTAMTRVPRLRPPVSGQSSDTTLLDGTILANKMSSQTADWDRKSSEPEDLLGVFIGDQTLRATEQGEAAAADRDMNLDELDMY